MPVVDASALIEVLSAPQPTTGLVERLAGEEQLQAPRIVELEVLSGLRRLDQAGALDAGRAEQARVALRRLRIVHHDDGPLHERIWELRGNLTVYDAAYVALAERLGASLITCDARLARAPGHSAEIELFATGA